MQKSLERNDPWVANPRNLQSLNGIQAFLYPGRFHLRLITRCHLDFCVPTYTKADIVLILFFSLVWCCDPCLGHVTDRHVMVVSIIKELRDLMNIQRQKKGLLDYLFLRSDFECNQNGNVERYKFNLFDLVLFQGIVFNPLKKMFFRIGCISGDCFWCQR